MKYNDARYKHSPEEITRRMNRKAQNAVNKQFEDAICAAQYAATINVAVKDEQGAKQAKDALEMWLKKRDAAKQLMKELS